MHFQELLFRYEFRLCISTLTICYHFQAAKFKFDEHKKAKHIEKVLPENSRQGYDIRDIINDVTDDDSFFEVSEEFAVNCVIGFAKIEGKSVGIIANNPKGMGGV